MRHMRGRQVRSSMQAVPRRQATAANLCTRPTREAMGVQAPQELLTDATPSHLLPRRQQEVALDFTNPFCYNTQQL